MSGLLERIVRRRRAPMSGWLGHAPDNGTPPVNGSQPGAPAVVNGASSPPVVHPSQHAATATDTAESAPTAPPPTETPQPTEKPQQTEATGFRERGRLRRRARYLRRLREVQLRDIGGFMVELHRFGRERPDLVKAKVQGASNVDNELKALEHALGDGQPLRELHEAGIGGACVNCGAVHGSEDNYCPACGVSLGTRSKAPDDH